MTLVLTAKTMKSNKALKPVKSSDANNHWLSVRLLAVSFSMVLLCVGIGYLYQIRSFSALKAAFFGIAFLSIILTILAAYINSKKYHHSNSDKK
ncbi:MAG: hypothetical protein MUC87_13960 [Bacteroidia bacterium]|jgi:biotin transporter BioY|nr:hypothetical protein [Bacteroidia bacterium]